MRPYLPPEGGAHAPPVVRVVALLAPPRSGGVARHAGESTGEADRAERDLLVADHLAGRRVGRGTAAGAGAAGLREHPRHPGTAAGWTRPLRRATARRTRGPLPFGPRSAHTRERSPLATPGPHDRTRRAGRLSPARRARNRCRSRAAPPRRRGGFDSDDCLH